MTKTKAKRSVTKASTSKTLATKRTSPPTSEDTCLLVLGFDEQQKPCGARFVGEKPDLVAKAAQLMGLEVYKASSPDVAEVAKKLPVGQLYATGRGFVPNAGCEGVLTPPALRIVGELVGSRLSHVDIGAT
jgi:hypothetical protein